MESLDSDKSGLECGALINEYDYQNKRKKLFTLMKNQSNYFEQCTQKLTLSLLAATFVVC